MINTPEFSEDDDRKDSDAHKIALELLKQIITLSSGVLALSATFVREFTVTKILFMIPLVLSWILLALSVLFGLESISAIVKSRINTDYDWSEGTGKLFGSLSKYSFVLGLISFAIFALITLVVNIQ